MQQTPWTLRTFNFDFPLTNFPLIISRLKGAYPRIKYLAENLDDKKLKYKPDGKWSILEHTGHLIDLEELHSGRLIDFRNREAVLRAWDGVNKKSEEAQHNEKNIKELLNTFKNIRKLFVEELLEFSDEELALSALHPRLKKEMRITDMAYFVAEHDDHHIAKMYSIINLPELP